MPSQVSYHADGSEGHETITAVAVWPGVPARILALLQDEHLATEVSLLEGNKAEDMDSRDRCVPVSGRGKKKRDGGMTAWVWREKDATS